MELKKGDIINATIENLAFGGQAVARIKLASGQLFVVFIEGSAIPGEQVEAELVKIKKNFAVARLKNVLQKSTERIKARCKHFGVCGGCSFQHLDYKAQLKYKEKIVADSLEKLGGFKDVKIEPIIGCENPWFYRNKMEYSFGQDEIGGILNLGLHPAKNFKRIFDAEECFLESEIAQKILSSVKKWSRGKNLQPFDPRVNSGSLKNLVIREGKNTNELLVNLIVNANTQIPENDFIDLMKENFPQITSLYKTDVKIQKGRKTVITETLLYGKKTLTEFLKVKHGEKEISLSFEVLPQAFFQPNTLQAQTLYSKILEFADPHPEDTVLDLFCGAGTIGMFFAKCVSGAIGIELNQSAIENARANAEKNSVSNIEFVCADIYKFLAANPRSLKPHPSILITDPPRAGISAKALKQIFDLNIKNWVYVSCNPTTLARDLKLASENGYKIKKIQPVDMFPHTYHIETVCGLTLT